MENNQIEIDLLSKNIINTLSMIPGVLGFVDKNEIDSERKLPSDDLEKGIDISLSGKIATLKLFLITSMEANMLLIIDEIHSSLKHQLKNVGFKLKDLNVFIKGVK